MSEAVMLVSNTSWSIVNFRQNLLALLRSGGTRVVVCAARDNFSVDIGSEYEFRELRSLSSHGTNPFREIRLLFDMIWLFRKIHPVVVFTFTIKPNIYGALAGRVTRTRVVSTVNGLGRATTSRGLVGAVTRFLYSISIKHASRVIFQNEDDREWMIERGIVLREDTELTSGSGVDLEHFTAQFLEKRQNSGRFLFCGRLLRSKGAELFAEAARLLKPEFEGAEFEFLGPAGDHDLDGISLGEIQTWEREGYLRYLGTTRDVRPHLAASHAVVLPSSYPEGVPRVLIEALACGKPVVTTDRPGCRDTVEVGSTGFLIQPGDLGGLVAALRTIITMDSEEYRLMCGRSRTKAERQFDERVVLAKYSATIREAV